jgi:hypothetical protein
MLQQVVRIASNMLSIVDWHVSLYYQKHLSIFRFSFEMVMKSALIPVMTASKAQGIPAGAACYKLYALRSFAMTQKLGNWMEYK